MRFDLLELYGRGYVVEHCVAAFMQEQEETRYRAYLTDALMAIAQNTANYAGGSAMNGRWYDAIKPTDNRDGDEIAKDIINRLGLVYRDGET